YVGTVVHLNGTDSFDRDGVVLAWQWNASTDNPSQVLIQNSSLPEASFLAPDVTGVYTFILKVRDDLGIWGLNDTVNVTVVLPPNVPPIAIAGADFAATVGEEVPLDGSASYDSDGTLVSWRWRCVSHPSLVIIGQDVMTASFSPTLEGMYEFSLSVVDNRGDRSPEDFINVTILPLAQNVPPLAEIAGSALREVYVGDEVVIDGSASRDDDGHIVEFLWDCTSHPGLSYEGQATSSISFTPAAGGDHIFILTVLDDDGTWSMEGAIVTVRVTERPVNAPPVAVISGPTSASIGEEVLLAGGTSYDPDGGLVSWRWASTSHPGLAIQGGDTSQASFVPSEAGEYVITLEVQDNEGLWSPGAEWTIKVLPSLEPPVADAGPDITIWMGDKADLDGKASYDPDGAITSWQWECTSHQLSSGLVSADSVLATFTPDAVGVYTFVLRVGDAEGLWSEADEMSVTVLEVNLPPIVSISDPIVGTLEIGDGRLEVVWVASDPNGDGLTFTVEVLSGFEPVASMSGLPAD
ncbi:MAG: hypothetical protein KAQ96_01560, partial [Thermoplasmata archaeon]|nr:hypothetical protein [Thermoplasmata archaeon]